MAFFHLHLANMCFRLREIVSTNKMINISKNLGRAYGKAGIRNRNWNPNLRNKTWRRFCLKSVTNNYCSIKTFHPHIILIYCYYIFYCRIFCAKFLFENFIYASGADPGFFLGGGALVSCSTSTPINHIVFFFAEYQLY